MFDSEEFLTDDDEDESDEDETIISDDASVERRSSGRPSRDLTIEDSDEGSTDESIIGTRRTTKSQNRRRKAIIDSGSDDDGETELENRALSPRTRMSITGVRPCDFSDDSSEIGYSEDDGEKLHKSGRSDVFEVDDSKNKSEESQIEREEGESDDEDDAAEVSKPNSFIEQSAAEKSDIRSSSEERTGSEGNGSPAAESSPPTVRRESVANSPLFAARYSTQFENAIKEKLSSTLYQPRPQANQSQNVSSDDSDLEIIERKENLIEILSSDDDDADGDDDINENKENHSSSPHKAKPVDTVPSRGTLVQPKIIRAMQQMPVPASAKKVKYVSQDFYNKEKKKYEELKVELLSAERLLEKISKNLPDGGKQLLLRIERLRSDVSIKEKYISSLVVEDAATSKSEGGRHPVLQQPFQPKVPDWDELSAAVNQIQPTHTGKQGLATFHNQKALTVDRLKDLHGSLKDCPGEHVLADDPKGLKVNLMAHQKHALAWMVWREKQKPRGGILADDMGLGKTLTMISLVLADKNDTEEGGKEDSGSEVDEDNPKNAGWSSKGRRDYYSGGTLVVCPASLIRQWETEVQTKVSRHKLTLCVHHGNNRDTKPKHLRTYDIVVTTYNLVAREQKTQGALFGIKWRRIILDEAHVVRNHKAQSSVAVCELRGKYRWALTGTPIQNKEMDVYALMKFLRCSPFDDYGHWKKWIDNKSAGGLQRLNTIMKTLMLRRTKIQLQERGELQCLPEKRTELIEIELDKDEMNVYQKIMIYSRTLFAQFLFQRAERNTDLMYRDQSSRPAFLQTKDPNGAYYKMHQKFTKLHHTGNDVKSHEILVLLLRLRQICCHPGLIDAMLEDEDTNNVESEQCGDNTQPEIDLLEQLNKLAITDTSESNAVLSHSLEENADRDIRPEEQIIAKASAKVLQRSNPVFDLKRPSSKMLKVLEILKKRILSTDDKAIVVSQWTSVLNILRTHLEGQGVATLSLNGAVAVKNRQDIISEFNSATSHKRILLLSLTAGGVGLNLMGANHLLLIDLHWNPQLEAQAQDRIYRVGQKKNVVIYKFMCKDTVEERIKALQDHKMQLANGVLTGVKASDGSKLSMEDLKSLFGM